MPASDEATPDGVRPARDAPPGHRPAQGTVSAFDLTDRAGSVLLDDGSPVDFPAAAFDASGLRLLRIGQRVRLEHGPDGTVSRVTLLTLG